MKLYFFEKRPMRIIFTTMLVAGTATSTLAEDLCTSLASGGASMSDLSGPCFISIYNEYLTPPKLINTSCADVSQKLGACYVTNALGGGDGEEFSRQWAQVLKQELETNSKYQGKYHVVHTSSYPKSSQTTLAQYEDLVAKDPSVQTQLFHLKTAWETEQAKITAEAEARANSVQICPQITVTKNATDAEKYQIFQSIFKDKSIPAECRNNLWRSISKSYRDMKEGEYLKAHPEKVKAALNQACGKKTGEERSQCEQSRYQAWSLTPIPAAKSDGQQLVCEVQNGAEAIAIETSLVATPKCSNLNAVKECFYNDANCDGPDGKSVGVVSCPSIDAEGQCPDVSTCANFTCPTDSTGEEAKGQAAQEE